VIAASSSWRFIPRTSRCNAARTLRLLAVPASRLPHCRQSAGSKMSPTLSIIATRFHQESSAALSSSDGAWSVPPLRSRFHVRWWATPTSSPTGLAALGAFTSLQACFAFVFRDRNDPGHSALRHRLTSVRQKINIALGQCLVKTARTGDWR
jgi:hypothetical protein